MSETFCPPPHSPQNRVNLFMPSLSLLRIDKESLGRAHSSEFKIDFFTLFSVNFQIFCLNFTVCVLNIPFEGSVSQIFHLDPSFYFMSKIG